MHSPYQGQGRILSLLKMEPEMSQKKLSFLLGIRPQSMAELLAKLEQNGYIVRKQSEQDRRSLDIQLTEKGKEAAEPNENSPEGDRNPDEMFGCLNEAEQKQLGNYLDRVIQGLQADLPEDGACFKHHLHGHHGRHGHPMGFCGHRPDNL